MPSHPVSHHLALHPTTHESVCILAELNVYITHVRKQTTYTHPSRTVPRKTHQIASYHLILTADYLGHSFIAQVNLSLSHTVKHKPII